MNNDLISRSALMSRIESERRQWGEDYDAEQILGDIEDFPTAYDVDKVVEQLEIRNKAIDDFKKDVKEAIDIRLEQVSPLSDVGSNLCTFSAIVDEIAEQLKGGGTNA